MVNQSNSDKMRLETESELCQVLIPLTSRYFKSQDLNIKYIKHMNPTEPDPIQIFDNEEAITNIKIEKSEDMISTIDHEYEYETKDSKLNDNLVSDDCDLIFKKEIEEDLAMKTESSDLSEFNEHCRSEDISSSAEFIELSGIDVSDTEIKIEDSVDPLSTDEFDSEV